MRKVSGNAPATFFDFQAQFVMFYVPKSKQFKVSVRIFLEFENRDAIAYLLRTEHIDGMLTDAHRFGTRYGAVRHDTRPAYRDAVIFLGVRRKAKIGTERLMRLSTQVSTTSCGGRVMVRLLNRLAFLFLLMLWAPVSHSQQGGALDIETCLTLARAHNETLLSARQRVEEIDYDKWVVRSRFFPKVDLETRYNVPDLRHIDSDLFRDEAILHARQRVLEFGADAPEEVAYRSRMRSARLDYERQTRRVLSQVRRNFYLTIVKGKQIENRREVLDNVREKLRRIRVKYEHGVAKEFDLLTAQLDSLEQEAQISVLLEQKARRTFDLLRLMGRDMVQDVALVGEVEDFEMNLEDAVAIALSRDVEIEGLGEEVAEVSRRFQETRLDYLPDIGIKVGMESGDKVLGFDLTRSQGTYRLDASSDVLLLRTGDLPLDSRFITRDTNKFALFQFSMPILSGFSRYGQTGAARARLYQVQASFRDRREQVERDVRQHYQTLQDRILQRQINTRRLEMDSRRLEIQERLRDLGQVTDNQVETFRDRFFAGQERLFQSQDAYINALENLREVMGYFE